jgi:preprotein translocase subunit Sss1
MAMLDFTYSKKKFSEVISLEEFNQILKQTKKPEHRLAFKLAGLVGVTYSTP